MVHADLNHGPGTKKQKSKNLDLLGAEELTDQKIGCISIHCESPVGK